MKRLIISLIIISLFIVCGVWGWNYSKKNEANNNVQTTPVKYEAQRSNNKKIDEINQVKDQTTVVKKETEIANFSTQIYNKDIERQNNIGIACRTLSTKEVQPGETFSFCNTVGKATHDKGYEEADIYVDGKKEQGLGGGLCQVSTTLYNAVLKVPELEIVERHRHSGHVPYIQSGKDAAISYGTYDFKFRNNTGNVIKIIVENTEDNIIAKLIKIE